MRDVKLSPAETRDSGKVRLGNMSPSLPAARPASAETADNGKVRIGNLSPSFPAAKSSAATADSGKVRLGNLSPSFPAAAVRRAATADSGKVRIGNMSPSFPAARPRRRDRGQRQGPHRQHEPELPGCSRRLGRKPPTTARSAWATCARRSKPGFITSERPYQGSPLP